MDDTEEQGNSFPGFVPPTSNYYKTPNIWIDISAEINHLGELKVVQYVLRHTWGYQEYGIKKAITTDEFMHGRKREDGSRIDKGTGLSNHSVIDGLRKAIKDGYLECEIDDSDKARIIKYYALKMQPSQSDVKNVHSQNSYEESAQPAMKKVHTGVKNVHSDCEESAQRSEKDTKERHFKKDTRRKKEEEGAHSQPPAKPSSSSHSLPSKNAANENRTQGSTTPQPNKPPTLKENSPRRSLGSVDAAKVDKSNTFSHEEQKIYDTLSPAAQKIYAEWCKMPWFIVRPELTHTLATHLETATAYQSLPLTAEIMLKVKEHATSPENDKQGYYKAKGWNFKFMLNELPQWLAVNNPAKQGKPQSTTASGMTQEESEQLARDVLAQTKEHGYSKIRAKAYEKDGAWLVRVVWETGFPLMPIASREQWEKTLKENLAIDQEDLLLKGAK